MASSSSSSSVILIVLFLTVIMSCSFSPKCVSYAQINTLKPGQKLRDWEHLVSANGVFRLGFFSPNLDKQYLELDEPEPRYLAIWFDQLPFYTLWVANRETPVPDSSGALVLDLDGLKITRQGGRPIPITPNLKAINSLGSNFNVIASLLDSGNLVVRQVRPDGTVGRVLWQSFDYPHNVLLPGMKLGMNLKTGHNWTLTSWVSDENPAPGAFRFGLDPSGVDQLLIWRREEVYFSTGVLKNGSFVNAPELDYFTKEDHVYRFKFVSNKEERYFTYSIENKSFPIQSKLDMDTTGVLTLFTLEKEKGFTRSIFNSISRCQTDNKNYTGVCLSEKPTSCRNESAMFVPKRGSFDYSYPSANLWYYNDDTKLGLSDCHAQCWKDCSCVGYHSYYEIYGTGCQYWRRGARFLDDLEIDGRIVYLLSYDGKSVNV